MIVGPITRLARIALPTIHTHSQESHGAARREWLIRRIPYTHLRARLPPFPRRSPYDNRTCNGQLARTGNSCDSMGTGTLLEHMGRPVAQGRGFLNLCAATTAAGHHEYECQR